MQQPPHLLLLLLLALHIYPSLSKDWADHWCEINDCKGVKAAEVKDEKMEARKKDVRIATRRYHATGEVRAIKSEHVKTAYFQYDGYGAARVHGYTRLRGVQSCACAPREERTGCNAALPPGTRKVGAPAGGVAGGRGLRRVGARAPREGDES